MLTLSGLWVYNWIPNWQTPQRPFFGKGIKKAPKWGFFAI